MPALTTRLFERKAIWAKIETTYGTDPVPTASANGIEARNVSFTPMKIATVENDVAQPYFGNSALISVAYEAQISFDIAIQGSGVAGTPPALGPLLRGAAHAETNLASAVTGTAQAGSVSQITLAAGASAVDNAYRGMKIDATGGTGSGQSAIIKSYNGTTKIAVFVDAVTVAFSGTTTYSIGPQTVYNPISSAIESLGIYFYMDGNLHKLIGVRGDVGVSIAGKKFGLLSFSFTGLVGVITDVPLTATSMTMWPAASPVNNAYTSGFTIHGFATNLYELSLKSGNEVMHRDDIIGYEDVVIVDRKPSGNVIIQAPLLAEKDFFTIAKAGTLGSLGVTHGLTAGNRFILSVPVQQITDGPAYESRNKVSAFNLPFRPINSSAGGDDYFLIFN